MNVLVAAETLSRIRLQEPRINLSAELKQLAHETSGAFRALVGDIDSWAKEVVQTRVNHVVHPGLYDPGDGLRLDVLSESIYFLVVLVLFRECGVQQDTLADLVNHDRVKWLVRQLKDGR